jgi:hypothetical protein
MALDIVAALAVAEQVVTAIIKIAPAVEQGIVDTGPYISALGGMLTGSNATQAQIDALLTQLDKDSADFQTAMPPDTTAKP